MERRTTARIALVMAFVWTLAGGAAGGAGQAAAQIITQIIDATGDGAGNGLLGANGIAVDAAGNTYVSGSFSNNAFTITSGGFVTQIIGATGDGAGNGLANARGIAVDTAGNVYLAGRDSDNAFQITPAGVITQIINAAGNGLGNILDGPVDIAVDAAGNVYVAGNLSNNAFKITPLGAITKIIDATGDGVGNGLDGSGAIAVDAAGNVYVAGRFSSNAFKITPGGFITQIIDSTGDGAGHSLLSTRGIAVDAAGNVYVAGFLSNNAFKITPGGFITQIIDSTGDGAGNGLGGPEGNGPTDIAVDAAGNIYVTGSVSNSNTFKITPGGVITLIIDSSGDGAGHGLTSPQGIAADAAGSIYVAGGGSNNAFQITPPPPINDDCFAAIASALSSELGDTTLATLDPAAPSCGLATTAPGVWYSVIGTGNTIKATTCNDSTTYDTQITVYCGGCSDLTCVDANNDDPMCGPSTQSTVSWCSAPGEEYLILVHGFAGATGFFQLDITDDFISCSPPVTCLGACCDPADTCSLTTSADCALLGGTFLGLGTTCSSPAACLGACCDPAGLCSLGTSADCALLSGTFLGLGTTCSPTTCLGACCDPAIGFCSLETSADCALLGGTFVGLGTTCGGALCPANDDCSAAISISVFPLLTSSESGDTTLATLDPAPPCAPAATAPGVWYSVIGTGDTITAKTCNLTTTYDSQISVYCGGCSGLACVAANNDDCVAGPNFAASTISWCSAPGVEYLILVHGAAGATGPFELDIFDDAVLCPPPALSWSGAVPVPPGAPAPSIGNAMAYDSARGVTVLFGGSGSGETWEWDGSSWTEKTPMPPLLSPGASPKPAMAYDAARAVTVLFGGSTTSETWVWDGASSSWTEVTPMISPPARSLSAMAYHGDMLSGVTVLFGGLDGSMEFDDTWTWDGTMWTDVTLLSPISPSPREDHAMAYDSARGKTVLFGGFGKPLPPLPLPSAPLDDTWEWEPVLGWMPMLPLTFSPAPRSEHAMAYDSALGKTVLFGGFDFDAAPPVFGDTWTWDGAAMEWTPVTTTGPTPRANAAMAYDIALGQPVLFGGATDAGPNDETWLLAAAPDCSGPVCPCRGDMNGDTILDGLDIQAFVDCMLGTAAPPIICACADIDASGVVDLGDLPLFVTTITTGVPCP